MLSNSNQQPELSKNARPLQLISITNFKLFNKLSLVGVLYIMEELKTNSYVARLLRGGLWMIVGTGFARLSTFFLMTMLARLLGANDFGLIGMLQSSLGVMATFAGLGLSNTALRYISVYKHDHKIKCGRIIGLLLTVAATTGVVATLVVALCSTWIATELLVASDLSLPIMLGGGVLFFSLLTGVYSGILIGTQRFSSLAFVELVDGLIGLLLVFILVYWFGLIGFSIALVLKSMTQWWIVKYLAKKALDQDGIIVPLRGVWVERSALAGFSLPAFLSNIAYAPIMWAGQTILVRTAGYPELGLFLAAIQINFLVTAFMSVFSQVSVSLLSESSEGDLKVSEFNHRFNLTIRANITAASIIGLFAYLGSPLIADWYGGSFAKITDLIPITLAFAAVNVGCATCGQFFSSANRMWLGFTLTSIWGVTFLSSLVYFNLKVNAQGVAYALLIAYWFVFLIQILVILYIRGMVIFKKINWAIALLIVLTMTALLDTLVGMGELVTMVVLAVLTGVLVRFYLLYWKIIKTRIEFFLSKKGMSK